VLTLFKAPGDLVVLLGNIQQCHEPFDRSRHRQTRPATVLQSLYKRPSGQPGGPSCCLRNPEQVKHPSLDPECLKVALVAPILGLVVRLNVEIEVQVFLCLLLRLGRELVMAE
jgi:hypothetical protein